jgi:electron transport complex protein RnfD
MLQVLYALVPGTLAMTWFFGWGVPINIVLATATAVACEALMLRLRDHPVRPYIFDLSAVVTGVLLALALPTITPWWIPVTGAAFGMVVAKHLYGGLGHNPFNPAMAGYVALLIAFPVEMTIWMAPEALREVSLYPWQSLAYALFGTLPEEVPLDAITMATPLDSMKTQLGMNAIISEIRVDPLFGNFGGRGWEWVSNGYLLGGVWLIYKKVITWHIPAAMLGALFAAAFLIYPLDPGSQPFPLFHVFAGGAMLGAFFIATDPVTACTSNRGKLVYGACIGVLVYVIRTWGGYPDAVAYSVLIMNMAAPTIDYYTRPQAFGQGVDRGG